MYCLKSEWAETETCGEPGCTFQNKQVLADFNEVRHTNPTVPTTLNKTRVSNMDNIFISLC